MSRYTSSYFTKKSSGQLNSPSGAVAQETNREFSRVPLIENIVMTAISGTVHGNVDATLIANLLGNLYIGNNNKININQVEGCLVLSDGASVKFTEEQLQFIAIRMEAIRNIPLSLAELQQGLINHCQSEHWYLKRLFDNAKIPIEESYITLSIITSEEHQKKQKELENVGKAQGYQVPGPITIDERTPSHEDLFVSKEPIALSDLFKKLPAENEAPKRLIIFGRAGIGKSILCQYLAIRWHQAVAGNFRKPSLLSQLSEGKSSAEKEQLSWLQNFKAVFWIRLREIPNLLKDSRNDGSLENIINLCCYGGKENQKKLKSSLEQHKKESLFILDGYDEIQDSFDANKLSEASTLDILWNILKGQPNVILTSRPTHNLDALWPLDNTVRKLELMGFSNEQIKDYVENFMAEPVNEQRRPASALLKYLNSTPSIWGIAHVPINLEILSWLYRKGSLSKKYNSLAMLYEEIIEAICLEMPKKHEAILKPFDVIAPNIQSKKITIRFLEKLAYQGMLKNELLLSEETIKSIAEQVLKVYKIPYEKRLTEKFLKISHQLGFLFPTGQDGQSVADQTHYFIHLSFQEHFAARYVASRLAIEEKKEKQKMIEKLQADKHNPSYQLMWWLTAGLLTHQGKASNYSALKIFAQSVFLGFLPQQYMSMSEMDFKLASHCLDECIGVNLAILSELLNDEEYTSLKKKMSDYFGNFVFYEGSNLREKTFETLERCPNFFSMKPFIDPLFFEKLISLAKGKNSHFFIRLNVFEFLLKIPEYTVSAVAGLKVFAEDKSEHVFDRRRVFETLLKIPEHAVYVAEKLKELAEDKSVDALERRRAFKILSNISGYAHSAAVGLRGLAQDKSAEVADRLRAFSVFLEIPEYAIDATTELKAWAEELKVLVEDKNISEFEKMIAFRAWLKIPGQAHNAAMELRAWAEDKSVYTYHRIDAFEALLKIPEHAVDAVVWLKTLAQDKSASAYHRRRAFEVLLKTAEHAVSAASGLMALGMDNSISAEDRVCALEVLLKTPEHAVAAEASLMILAEDMNIRTEHRISAFKALLKTPEYAVAAGASLMILAEDMSIRTEHRISTFKALLEIPEYAVDAVAGLRELAEDASERIVDRKEALIVLLHIPEQAHNAVVGLRALAEDKSIWTFLTDAPRAFLHIALSLYGTATHWLNPQGASKYYGGIFDHPAAMLQALERAGLRIDKIPTNPSVIVHAPHDNAHKRKSTAMLNQYQAKIKSLPRKANMRDNNRNRKSKIFGYN